MSLWWSSSIGAPKPILINQDFEVLLMRSSFESNRIICLQPKIAIAISKIKSVVAPSGNTSWPCLDILIALISKMYNSTNGSQKKQENNNFYWIHLDLRQPLPSFIGLYPKGGIRLMSQSFRLSACLFRPLKFSFNGAQWAFLRWLIKSPTDREEAVPVFGCYGIHISNSCARKGCSQLRTDVPGWLPESGHVSITLMASFRWTLVNVLPSLFVLFFVRPLAWWYCKRWPVWASLPLCALLAVCGGPRRHPASVSEKRSSGRESSPDSEESCSGGRRCCRHL